MRAFRRKRHADHPSLSPTIMNITTPTCTLAIACLLSQAAVGQPALQFDAKQLSGWWAESYNTDVTCGPQNLRVRHEFSADGRRLLLRFDRKWKTELGETEKFEATVVSSTERTLTIRYDAETRKKRNGQPVEWELSIVAPGVYRWRETEWRAGEVNTVVGLRCPE